MTTDFAWLKEREVRGSDVRDVSDEYGLIAVQGPRALERSACRRRRRSRSPRASRGVTCMVNRTGYTGEEGVELLAMADETGELWDAVIERGVTPCGLGARDSLRLEVCFPLHGNDIGPETDAISAGLAWTARSTRTSPAPSSCAGSRSAGPSSGWPAS